MSVEAYEVGQRNDKRGVNLISDALPFGRLWYDEPNAVSTAIGYAKHRSRSHDAVIRVYHEAGTRSKRTSTRAISKSHIITFFRRVGRLLVLFLSAQARQPVFENADHSEADRAGAAQECAARLQPVRHSTESRAVFLKQR